MKNIGEKIAELRKEKGMTQEALSEMIGVSYQSISKWENGITMPDIMLLPVIANIFDISIDELFSVKHIDNKKTFDCEDTPNAVYDAVLNTMWQDFDFASKARKSFVENNEQNSGFVAKNGRAVYANQDIALTFLPDYTKASGLLESNGAADVLCVLSDKTVRDVLKYLAMDPGRSFTAASIATKTRICETEVVSALDKLINYNLTICRDIEIDSGKKVKIYQIYQIYGAHKMVFLVYPILSLAERLSNFRENWCGFRG